MKQKFKTYKFWVALSSAVIIFIKTLGEAFGFDVNGEIINSIIMAFCGVLVVIGFVDKPETNIVNENSKTDIAKDENEDNNNNNSVK